jgi:putative transposase
MARKIYKPEEIVNLLRQVEVAVANGKMTPQACKDAGIVEQTYYRWRKEYGGLKVDQVRQMKQLQEENTRLKQLVAELSLDKTMLQDVLRKKF